MHCKKFQTGLEFTLDRPFNKEELLVLLWVINPSSETSVAPVTKQLCVSGFICGKPFFKDSKSVREFH